MSLTLYKIKLVITTIELCWQQGIFIGQHQETLYPRAENAGTNKVGKTSFLSGFKEISTEALETFFWSVDELRKKGGSWGSFSGKPYFGTTQISLFQPFITCRGKTAASVALVNVRGTLLNY